MPFFRGTRYPILGNVGGVNYLLYDAFHDTLAAGSINGTFAQPGPGTRAVTDTSSDATITAGRFTTTDAQGNGDPGLWYGAQTRTAGRVLLGLMNADGQAFLGWDINASAAITGSALRITTTGLWAFDTSSNIVAVGTVVASTDYKQALVTRAAGGFYFIKGGAFTEWTLVWIGASDSTATLYPAVAVGTTGNKAHEFDNIRIPDILWTPTPIVSDSFDRANAAIGTTDGAGCEETAATLLAWESGGATWTVSGNEAINTPTEGIELVTNGNFANWTGDDPDSWTVIESGPTTDVTEVATGEGHAAAPTIGGGFCNFYRSGGGDIADPRIYQSILTAGTWYIMTFEVDTATSGELRIDLGGTSIGITTTGSKVIVARAANTWIQMRSNADPTDMTFDDISINALTLNTLFTDVDDSATSDVVITVECDVIVSTSQAGIVMNLDDATTPANFVIAYHDGTNAKLEKCVAGTYTSVISAAATYAAGAELRVIKSGTSYTLYYNNAKIGSTSTISDAGIVDNTKHGLFSTYSGNQLDNFYVFATGTDGEYSDLDAW